MHTHSHIKCGTKRYGRTIGPTKKVILEVGLVELGDQPDIRCQTCLVDFLWPSRLTDSKSGLRLFEWWLCKVNCYQAVMRWKCNLVIGVNWLRPASGTSEVEVVTTEMEPAGKCGRGGDQRPFENFPNIHPNFRFRSSVVLPWVAFQIWEAWVWEDSYCCPSLSNFSAPPLSPLLSLLSLLLPNSPTRSKTKSCLLQHCWAASQSTSMRCLALPRQSCRWPCHWLGDPVLRCQKCDMFISQGVIRLRGQEKRSPKVVQLWKDKCGLLIQVSGQLGVVSPDKLILTQFNYDGLGPAAFFLAGASK